MKKMSFVVGLLLPFLTANSAVAASNHPAIVGSRTITAQIAAGNRPVSPGTSPRTVNALATVTNDGTIIQPATVPRITQGHGNWVTIRGAYFRLDDDRQPIGFVRNGRADHHREAPE